MPRWQSQLESYNEMEGYPGPDLPYLAEIQAFLEANRPEPSPTGIIHGDYHLANVMFARLTVRSPPSSTGNSPRRAIRSSISGSWLRSGLKPTARRG